MPRAGGQGGLYPTLNLGLQLNLFKPGGPDYAHRVTASPPGFENLSASLPSPSIRLGLLLAHPEKITTSFFLCKGYILININCVGKTGTFMRDFISPFLLSWHVLLF